MRQMWLGVSTDRTESSPIRRRAILGGRTSVDLVQRWKSYGKLSIAAVQGRFARRPPISPPTWGRSMAWKMVLGRLVDDGGGWRRFR